MGSHWRVFCRAGQFFIYCSKKIFGYHTIRHITSPTTAFQGASLRGGEIKQNQTRDWSWPYQCPQQLGTRGIHIWWTSTLCWVACRLLFTHYYGSFSQEPWDVGRGRSSGWGLKRERHLFKIPVAVKWQRPGSKPFLARVASPHQPHDIKPSPTHKISHWEN